MIKTLMLIIKKVILGLLLLYAYNVIAFPLNVVIPINVFTILFVTVLGFPAMIGLCLFSLFIL